MSNEDLLSRGKDFEQKLQEALVVSTFALVFQEHISPVQIRMAKVHEKLRDFELISQDNASFQFEITTAYPPDYKLEKSIKMGDAPLFLCKLCLEPQWIQYGLLR